MADKSMETIDLAQDIRGEDGTLYLAGKDRKVPSDLAAKLREPIKAADDGKAPVASKAIGAPGGSGAGSSGRESAEAELAELSKGELVELAEEHSIEVTRGDGAEGEPVKADYVKALAAANVSPK